MRIYDSVIAKTVRSENYNYDFSKRSGKFVRWGRSLDDDPQQAPAPEIADIEISTICNGLGAPCRFCYKTNTRHGKNMSLETFKAVFAKLPPTLTQIAFGIGDIDSNPDMFPIFEHCRESGIVPNVTINGWNLTYHQAKELKRLCGAVAVSRYEPKTICYDAVTMLADDLEMKQVNIHQLVSKETLPACLETIKDSQKELKLRKLNAIVFLTLKPKGGRNDLRPVTDEEYKQIIDTCLDSGVRFGFDSCSANRFLRLVKGHENEKFFTSVSEPCESTLFSCYINVDGDYFPCSFSEGEGDWKEGLNVTNCNDFVEDIWQHEKTKWFRASLFSKCRDCPLFDI